MTQLSESINDCDADVLVVGAGAAGLMSAIFAARRGARVLVLDSQKKIGAKILVSGGGRCNVTNVEVEPSRFHTSHSERGPRSFVARVLRSFSVEQTHRFFREIGIELKLEETGKYFPTTDSARTVLHALLEATRESGAQLTTECEVLSIGGYENCDAYEKANTRDGKSASSFAVKTRAATFRARAVILCTGGLALPKSGSNGVGFEFAKRFGHTIVETTPALTPLLSNVPAHAALSGITMPARLSLRDGARVLADYTGSFLWTHHGYSGPVALNISRHVAREKNPNAKVFLRVLIDVKDGDEARFWHEFTRENARKSLLNALREKLPQRVAEMMTQLSGEEDQSVGKLSGAASTRARDALLNLHLPVHAVAPYVKAETTAGGVCLDEIESASMMSKLQEGLFFAGEICDVDGWLGGYNFQWAWSSGAIAGRSAAKYAASFSKPSGANTRD